MKGYSYRIPESRASDRPRVFPKNPDESRAEALSPRWVQSEARGKVGPDGQGVRAAGTVLVRAHGQRFLSLLSKELEHRDRRRFAVCFFPDEFAAWPRTGSAPNKLGFGAKDREMLRDSGRDEGAR
jgi:hypothetical protein